MVNNKDIEIDLDKIAAIRDILSPKTTKEIRGFMGRINYTEWFISNLVDKCKPIFKLLRKDISLDWNKKYRASFEHI